MYTKAMAATGLSYKSAANTKSVCRAFELSRRRENLSFGHHAEVASLPEVEQDRLLDLAATAGLSRDDIRKKAEKVRYDLAAPGEFVRKEHVIAMSVQKLQPLLLPDVLLRAMDRTRATVLLRPPATEPAADTAPLLAVHGQPRPDPDLVRDIYNPNRDSQPRFVTLDISKGDQVAADQLVRAYGYERARRIGLILTRQAHGAH
jgi:hypothetical protein